MLPGTLAVPLLLLRVPRAWATDPTDPRDPTVPHPPHGVCVEDHELHACAAPLRVLGGCPLVVLHLCSGRRRPGDVQSHLEEMAAHFRDQCGCEVAMVSVDVAIDPDKGNLASLDTLRFWAEHALGRRVVGMVGGPPCETWSRVRGVRVDDRPGPPKLRSEAEPWGLHALTERQYDQLRVATLLLHGFLLLFCALAARGGFALLEHPAEPAERGLCSIWRLPIVRRIAQHPCVWRHRFNQGPLGQVSPKPTELLLLRLGSLAGRLRELTEPADAPLQPRAGRLEDGTWATACLKEYPPRMCLGIARAIRDEVGGRTVAAPASTEDAAAVDALHCLVQRAGGAGLLHQDFDESAAAALPRGAICWSGALPGMTG